jgi:hypothetical protein
MAAKKYITLDTATGRFRQNTATQVSAGSANGGDIVALGDDGKIDSSMMPSSGTDSTDSIVCTEALAQGDWVNIYNNGGTRACRKALAADATKPAHGFVSSAYTSGQSASVSKKGDNAKVALTGFVAADIGSRVFLSAATGGATTKTCPSTVGNLVQPLGTVSDVTGSFVIVAMEQAEQVQL